MIFLISGKVIKNKRAKSIIKRVSFCKPNSFTNLFFLRVFNKSAMAAAVVAVVVSEDKHSDDVCIILLLNVACKKPPRLNGVGMIKQILGLLGANGFLSSAARLTDMLSHGAKPQKAESFGLIDRDLHLG